jgi:hypothetical protein
MTFPLIPGAERRELLLMSACHTLDPIPSNRPTSTEMDAEIAQLVEMVNVDSVA